MRTWKCPACGQTEEISYDWLAARGGPVCGQCDHDMELQPEATAIEYAAVVDRLADKADDNGLEAEDIDELVHELAASVAADVNNGGLDEQLRYLVDGLGAQYAERQLNELIENRVDRRREGE
ncbi:MAG: hypothetical protein GXY83_20840 [Rhodopirellula sp.]|nr:hypothetical protein [Rhodopirellula sp.]